MNSKKNFQIVNSSYNRQFSFKKKIIEINKLINLKTYYGHKKIFTIY